MGSLAPSPPLPPEDTAAGTTTRIYAAFCPSDPALCEQASNWLESYTPADNTWQRAGAIPGVPPNHVLKGFSMVSLGRSLYIIGGRLVRKDLAGESDVAVRGDVLRHDAVTGEWSACAPLHVPRFDFACAACGGRIYAAGGLVGCGAAGTAAAEAYDPAADRWDPLPGMRSLRYKCVGVAWSGRFHVVGGFAQRDGAAAAAALDRSSAEAYDDAAMEWEVRPGMWALDVPPNQVVAVGGRLLSSGDCLNTWKGHLDGYDGKLNLWNVVEGSQLEELSPVPVVGRRAYLTMGAVGGRLYFLAGYREVGSRSVSVVHAFDIATAAWRSFEPVEEEMESEKELCGHCCVVQL